MADLLQREGYAHLDRHFSGKTLSKQLIEVVRRPTTPCSR